MEDDIDCLDLSLALLSAAAHSRKWHSHLLPFPSDIISNGDEEKDITELRKIIQALIHKWKKRPSTDSLTSPERKLINWITSGHKFRLSQTQSNDPKSNPALAHIFSKVSSSRRHHSAIDNDMLVYELEYKPASEEAWAARRGKREVFYGFHGSGASNFHSILRHGLLNHMNSRALYGEGIYLSKSFSTANTFSETSSTHAPSSRFGKSLRVIAVCQVIDDRSVYRVAEEDDSDSRPVNQRIQAPNSEGGQLPTDYIIVRNNDMQRIKYLVVFPESKADKPRHRRPPRLFRFLAQHHQFCWIIFYILCLVFAGIATNKRLRFKLLQFYDSAIYLLGSGDLTELEH